MDLNGFYQFEKIPEDSHKATAGLDINMQKSRKTSISQLRVWMHSIKLQKSRKILEAIAGQDEESKVANATEDSHKNAVGLDEFNQIAKVL